MKYEKEATTKNGRRTWKVTYELVRGPEPKKKKSANPENSPSSAQGKRKTSRAAPAAPAKAKPQKAKPKPAGGKKEQQKAAHNQLGLF